MLSNYCVLGNRLSMLWVLFYVNINVSIYVVIDNDRLYYIRSFYKIILLVDIFVCLFIMISIVKKLWLLGSKKL